MSAPHITVHEMTYVGGFLGLDVSLSPPVSYIDMSRGVWFDADEKVMFLRNQPLAAPGYSFEKWVLLKLQQKPVGTSFLWNFKFWCGNVARLPGSSVLRVGPAIWMTREPVDTPSPIARTDVSLFTVDDKGVWPGLPLMADGWNTYPLVFQLELKEGFHAPMDGNQWVTSPIIIDFTFDEV